MSDDTFERLTDPEMTELERRADVILRAGSDPLAKLILRACAELRLRDAESEVVVRDGYRPLANVFALALQQAQDGKGAERHSSGEPFVDQPIVRLGEWMGAGRTSFVVGQACKKAIESTRLSPGQARQELLGAINYLAAAVIIIDREGK